MSKHLDQLTAQLAQARDDLAAGRICQADYDYVVERYDQALDEEPGPITAAVDHYTDQLQHHVIGAVRDDEADGFTRVSRLEILQTQALCRIADALTNLTEDN
ncbi:hypothetical protein [Corynebacterium nuruki]|uniref:hypothetical protein n=1 Tax=Corynebacterium nuruki TaxID=1032851 RepID=UPI0039BF9690